MSNLYENLKLVHVSMMNVIGHMYLDGKPRNMVKLINDVGSEFAYDGFMDELLALPHDQLIDLGFEYIMDDSVYNILMFPAWLAPFIPEGTKLTGINGGVIIVGIDEISTYADHWLDIGVSLDHNVDNTNTN